MVISDIRIWPEAAPDEVIVAIMTFFIVIEWDPEGQLALSLKFEKKR